MSMGILIAIEGIDGCGGTTQTKLTAIWLRKKGIPVEETLEPTDGPIGKLIRDYIRTPKSIPIVDALLFAADRVEHVERMKASLNQGINIITDRYLDSSMAYQVSEGVPYEWVISINMFALKPEITIVLDVDPEIALMRKVITQDKFEKIDFLKDVRKQYLKFINENPHTYKVDASNSIGEVQQDIQRILREKMNIKD